MTDTHIPHASRPIVAKFGGSSVADADQVRKIAAIVRADPRRRFVVVSAPGKRDAKDKKITDLLYLCHSLGEQGLDASAPFAVIKERYLGIAGELGVPGAWEWLRDMGQQIAGGAAKDWVASRGEWLSARIIAAYLDAEFVDAADGGIRFGADGRLHHSRDLQPSGGASGGRFPGQDCRHSRLLRAGRAGPDQMLLARRVGCDRGDCRPRRPCRRFMRTGRMCPAC